MANFPIKPTNDQVSKAKQALSMNNILKQDYDDWYSGKSEKDGIIHTFDISIESNTSSSFNARNIYNGDSYQVKRCGNPYVESAKIHDTDGSIISIKTKDFDVTRPEHYNYEFDFNNDEVADYLYQVQYTRDGKVHSTRDLYDMNGDGVIDDNEVDEYCSYCYDDTDGHLTGIHFASHGYDGNRYEIKNEYYNDDPYTPTMSKTTSTFYGDDGRVESSKSQSFDPQGRLIEEAYDGPEGGLFSTSSDYVRRYGYDEFNRVKIETYDDHKDDSLISRILGKSNDYTKEYCYEEMLVRQYNSRGKLVDTQPITEDNQ